MAEGPAVQEVVVRAVDREGRPVVMEDVLVRGRTAGGDFVEIDRSVVAQAVGDHDAGRLRDEIVFQVDVRDLLSRNVTEIELTYGSSTFTLPIRRQGAPDSAAHGLDDVDRWQDESVLEWNIVAGPDVEVEAEAEEGPGVEPEPLGDASPDMPDPPSAMPELPLDMPDPSSAHATSTDESAEAAVAALAPAPQTREVRTLRAGTSQATPAYIIRSSRPGPTVMVVGGVHGSETAGWMAAGEIKDWRIDRGTLVVLPQANRPAVQRSRRTGPDGIDLNRQFPVGGTPRTALAREIWSLVREFRPAALIDLHEGWGVRRLGHRFPGGTPSVGQTLIAHTVKDARQFANHAIRYVNTHHVGRSSTYQFMVIGPPTAGSLARKAGSDLGIPSFIVEPSQYQTSLATRMRWTKAFVQELLKWYGVIDQGRTLVTSASPDNYPGNGARANRPLAAAA